MGGLTSCISLLSVVHLSGFPFSLAFLSLWHSFFLKVVLNVPVSTILYPATFFLSLPCFHLSMPLEGFPRFSLNIVSEQFGLHSLLFLHSNPQLRFDLNPIPPHLLFSDIRWRRKRSWKSTLKMVVTILAPFAGIRWNLPGDCPVDIISTTAVCALGWNRCARECWTVITCECGPTVINSLYSGGEAKIIFSSF